ncbi:MAG: MFS transporter [Chthoniobacteraceae bacterium]
MDIPPSKILPDEHLLKDCKRSSSETSLVKIYVAGTLRYTLRKLSVLFLWLLWGDFAFTFFESIFGRFLPLYLKDLQASNSLIGIMAGSFAGLMNILFLPNISQWSDNYRSRLGRRIPFLYVVAPLATASLVAVGFAPEIAAWLYATVLSRVVPSISMVTVVLSLLCAFVVSFHFFNMVLVNTYNWLLRDVVPLEFMARFLSWFRIVGTVSSGLFLWYVFPHVISHRKEVCLSVGLVYLVFFLLMCCNVKEGEYPPPVKDRRSILKSYVHYFRDCLSIPIYRNFFIAYVLAVLASTCASPFTALFNRDTLGVSMDDMGKIFAWTAAISAVLYFPMGYFCDKFSPMRVGLASVVAQVFGCICTYILVTDKTSFLVWSLIVAVPTVGWGLAYMATTMELFPEEKFGQFSSGLNVFACGALIFGNYLVGQLIDFVHSDYRMIYVWSAVLYSLAIVPMFLVYRGWRQHGGPRHYVPPLPELSRMVSSRVDECVDRKYDGV